MLSAEDSYSITLSSIGCFDLKMAVMNIIDIPTRNITTPVILVIRIILS